MISDEMLYQIMPQLGEGFLNELNEKVDEAPIHRYSLRFKVKMRALINKVNRQERAKTVQQFKPLRVLAVAIIAIIATTITVFAVPALRNAVIQMFRNSTEVTFNVSESSAVGSAPMLLYAPEYIPDGFALSKSSGDEDTKSNLMVYKDANNNVIDFSQHALENFSININTNGEEFEEIEVNNHKMHYSSSMGMQTLWWNDEQCFYIISSNLDKNELIKIAKATRLKK